MGRCSTNQMFLRKKIHKKEVFRNILIWLRFFAAEGENMNYIELGVWAFFVLTLVAGVLLGLLRGSRRAILRLSLVLVCVLVAFLLKDWLSNLVLAINITDESGNTFTVQQGIINMLPTEVQKAGETIVIPLVRTIMNVVAFLWVFTALCSFTWMVIFPICKIFVKPKAVVDAGGVPVKDENGKVVRKKHAAVGSAVGAVQGIVVALCICIPLVGLAVQTNRVLAVVNDLEQTQQTAHVAESDKVLAFTDEVPAGAPENVPAEGGSEPQGFDFFEQLQALLGDIEDTAASKFFYEACRPMFDAVSTVKVENADGTTKQVVLSKQITAIKDTVDLAKPLLQNYDKISEQLQSIQSASTGDDVLSMLKSLTADGSPLKDVFAQLDAAKGNLSEEQKEMVNDLMVTVVDSISLPESAPASAQGVMDNFKEVLADTDFTDVNFSGELDVIVSVTETMENMQNSQEMNAEDLAQVINEVSESTLVLPVLEQVGTNVDLGLSQAQQDQLKDIIDQLPPETDQETLNVIKNFLGI